MIGVELNSKAAIAAINMLINKVPGASDSALNETALEGLRLSQEQVPHDEGTLQNSGAVEDVSGGVVLGYHTKYAARLHEHPEYRFQKGRKGKYIEDPLVDNADVLNIKFGKEFQMRLF